MPHSAKQDAVARASANTCCSNVFEQIAANRRVLRQNAWTRCAILYGIVCALRKHHPTRHLQHQSRPRPTLVRRLLCVQPGALNRCCESLLVLRRWPHSW
jgi:hypothetical protein